MRSHQLGRDGEEMAVRHLAERGWRILERNFRVGHKEVDIVAGRAGVVAFVEVKTRTASDFGHPLDAVTAGKRREIEHVARAWIARHGAAGEAFRFDVVAITIPPRGEPRIEHVEDAWRV